MKKVLFVAAPQSHIMNFHLPFLKYFHDKNYEVFVATKLDREKYKKEMQRDTWVKWNDIDFSRSPFSSKSLKAYKQLKELMKEHQFDLIHVHTPMGGFLGRLAAKNTKQKVVLYTAHGFHFFQGASKVNWALYYNAEKLAAKWTDGLITMNEEDYSNALKLMKNRDNVFKVNGVGVDLSKSCAEQYNDVRAELGIGKDDFVISVVAEFIPRKNHIQIIDAIDLVKKRNPNYKIKVLMAGDGDLIPQIKDIISTKELKDDILLLGFRKDVISVLKASDALALTSKQEGLPKNVMEAMACKLPIITTDVRGNRDLVDNMKNGIVVPLYDVEATANAIEKLYNNDKLRKEFSKCSYEKVQNYSIDNVLIEMDKIYTKFLEV
ncbi:glycosyltransferase family 4 protein [Inconstantimicrobium mannanitabidum]|uniref:Glycosyl transferase family 1 n=1 Tax=Inconstantimicrobium mannanitabidum TaxID=1604901 RepID=A0ACB5RA90_9CLOT|nr:glycosyltransferase family 4 protein [Clostridium sp. TW13]GKX66105.1 glycosyl transferase family 1 [Clostridium sp. TW13]